MNIKSVVQNGVSSLFIVATIVCIFTPSLLLFKQFTAYTLYIMLGLLAAGFLSFIYHQQRLMMVSLLCCCVLCLHLKASANKEMRLATVTANPSIRVSHISLGNAESDYDTVIDYLLGIDADFLSFQELTPDWNAHLIDRLSPVFGHIRTMTRLDQYGMGFFSKIPFQSMDTVYFLEIPNLSASVFLGENQKCNIISCQVMPPVNQAAFDSISSHFNLVTEYIQDLEGTTVVLGDFHLPPWSAEVQKFKTSGHLNDGRRDIHPRNLDGSLSLPRIPVEHILYSDQLECTSFSEIGNALVGRIGITGTYQLQQINEEMAE